MTDDAERAAYDELRVIIARLRAPDGCPWDREQTHASLRPYLLQEAYEVLAALDEGDTRRLPDEMGDLLFQVLLHTQLAEEAGEFTITDVYRGLAAKLVRRHPHVFGDTKLGTAAEVVAQWDDLKRGEREADESALASVPRAMAALALAQELLDRAARAGFAWPARDDVLAKIAEEADEVARARSDEERREELGDLLLNLANYARYLGVDAVEALRLAANKFRRRFEAVEGRARAAGHDPASLSREELMARWEQAKASEGV